MKKREYAIDFLKFFAALLITNSHLEVFDPTYPLATGGSIGDVLFLFCSGYTLFMGKMGRFDNWYKRRLNRIFPPPGNLLGNYFGLLLWRSEFD